MNSYIFIDGPVLWVVIGFIFLLLVWLLYFSFHCTKLEKSNDKLKAENRKLRKDLSNIRYQLYRGTYKTPEVE